MANKFKKFFAMLLVMCMLTGMLPVQALAEQEEPALEVIPMEDLQVDVAVDEETNTVVVEFAPVDETVDAPAGEVEWVSGATHDAEIETTVTEIAVSEPVESSSDEPAVEEPTVEEPTVEEPTVEEPTVEEPAPETTVESTTVIESVTVETNGTLEDGTVVTGEETYTETTTTTTETTTETTVDANGNETITETVTETVTVQGVVEGEETAVLEDAEITTEDTDLPEVEVPAYPSDKLLEDGEKEVVVESETVTSKDKVGEIELWGEGVDVVRVSETNKTTTTTEKVTVTDEEKVEEENKTVETSTTTTVDKTTVEEFHETVDEWVRQANGKTYFTDVQQETDVVVNVTTNVTVTETTTEVTGDVKEGDDDLEYDFTNIETTIIRDVTTDVEVKVDDESTFDMNQVIAPEEYEGKNYSGAGVKDIPTSSIQFDGLLAGTNPNDKDPASKPEDESYEGYDYVLSGTGDATLAAAPVFMNVVYEKNEDGTPKQDADGNYIIKETSLVYAGDKAGNSGMNGTPSQIVVKKGEGEDAEYFYTYCIDKVTPTFDESWYKITNLEDSDYYPDDGSAAMLRAIVTNGYWGTDPSKTETEEGNEVPNQGSIESVKALLRENYDADATVTVTDAQGNEHTYNVADLIDGLKEHEALAATQAAIWSYSNGSLAAQNGQDGVICVGVQSAKKHYNGITNAKPSALNQYSAAYDLESDARLKALYDCFMNLDPMAATPENTTTVINEQNFLKDVNLNVGDKVEDREEVNEETGETVEKDVYETELEFTLAFVVDDQDNLTVVLLKDGQPVMEKHLANSNEAGDENTIVPDENGVYTLSGLQLSENEAFNFDLQLKGTQVLEEGVYVYTAHGGTGHSQTLVGLAAGTQNVNVSASMTIEFDVDESKNVVATRQWRTESDPVTSTTTNTNKTTGKEVPPAEEEEEPEPPVMYRMARGVGQLETIIDEEVPLAEVPQTGDNSIVWFALILMSVCGLCVLNLSDKKCKA